MILLNVDSGMLWNCKMCRYFDHLFFLFNFQLLLLNGFGGGLLEDNPVIEEKDDVEADIITTAESINILKTNNGQKVSKNQSETIIEIYNKVSDKEEDQEILLNLIEKSKEPKVSSDVVNYVTKKPRAIKSQRLKLKKSHENKVLETHKKRRKRKKLIQNLNRRRKPSHMQVKEHFF